MNEARDTIVVALGGNAIARAGDDGTLASQYRRANEALAEVAALAASGARVVLTHGNGPVVGAIVLRGELASGEVPPTPLYIAGADSEGGIGLMLQQVLGNHLAMLGSDRTVVTLVTQSVVDALDPAFNSPTKPIGPYYPYELAHRLAEERGWVVTEEPGRGWRRVVASPHPLDIVEVAAVSALLDAGCVPIAAGGGGVPVVRDADRTLRGVDCVIDKDWASAVLAERLSAPTLAILMEADALYRHWGSPDQKPISEISASDATALALSGALAGGGIRPKVLAAAHFVRSTGGTAILCASGSLSTALDGSTGTRIVP